LSLIVIHTTSNLEGAKQAERDEKG
jgi:hypothetical protein